MHAYVQDQYRQGPHFQHPQAPPVARSMQVVFSPHLPQNWCPYLVTQQGIRGTLPPEQRQEPPLPRAGPPSGPVQASAASRPSPQQQQQQQQQSPCNTSSRKAYSQTLQQQAGSVMEVIRGRPAKPSAWHDSHIMTAC